jgi:two-component system cell cycle sensor histidine kinase/response regulator CckA
MMNSRATLGPAQLTAIYSAVAIVWIIGTDLLVYGSLRSAGWSLVKGSFFVTATAVLLNVLTRRMAERIRRAGASREAELSTVNQQLRRVQGVNAALARVNRAAMKATDEAQLCQQIVDTLAESAGLRLVFIGWVDEATLRVVCGASAGEAEGYLAGLDISVAPEDPRSREPTGRSIIEGVTKICLDIETDESMRPWRERALGARFRSNISLPVRVGLRRGTITAYAEDPGYFDVSVVDLMEQLAFDLQQGLQRIAELSERGRIDAELKASEARYRSLFAGSAVVMLLIDESDGAIVDANAAACQFYGWSKAEITALKISDINTLTPAEIKDRMSGVQVGGVNHFQFRHRRADGEVRDVEVYSGRLHMDGRALLHSIVHDNTRRVQAESELADAYALNQAVMEHAPLGLIVWSGDGRIVKANASAVKLVGGDHATLRDLNFRESSTWKRIGLDQRADRVLRTGHHEGFQAELETSLGRKVQIRGMLAPIPVDATSHLLAVLQDATAEEAATARMRLLEAAIEAAPTGIVISSATGEIQWVNAAFTTMTGYEAQDVTGKNVRMLKSGRQGESFYSALWETVSKGKIWSGELQNQRRDGSIYWEHMLITPVLSPDRGVQHYVAIKKDVSDRKQMENQVARTQRLESIGLLAGGIAHDLNNVLAPIMLAMDIFKLRYTDPGDRERLEMVRRSAERGAGIVKQILTFARGVDGERATLQPAHIVKEVRNLIRETLPRKIDIQTDLADNLFAVQGDLTQLHQVMLNLCVNARDAMQDGGLLTVGARNVTLSQPLASVSGLVIEPGNYVLFTVRDTGTGILPEVMDQMFVPFFTTKARGAGTGLGLSTAFGIVRGHHGAIDVETALGQGTEFRVYLPGVKASLSPAVDRETPAHIAGDGRTILVVDDEENVRIVTAMVLKAQGFVVTEAADGEEAIRLFQENPGLPCAVVLDLVMPRAGGDAVATVIKQRRPELPIILTSGLLSDRNSSNDAESIYRRLGDVLLRKPFSQGELISALAKLLDPKPGPGGTSPGA